MKTNKFVLVNQQICISRNILGQKKKEKQRTCIVARDLERIYTYYCHNLKLSYYLSQMKKEVGNCRQEVDNLNSLARKINIVIHE